MCTDNNRRFWLRYNELGKMCSGLLVQHIVWIMYVETELFTGFFQNVVLYDAPHSFCAFFISLVQDILKIF